MKVAWPPQPTTHTGMHSLCQVLKQASCLQLLNQIMQRKADGKTGLKRSCTVYQHDLLWFLYSIAELHVTSMLQTSLGHVICLVAEKTLDQIFGTPEYDQHSIQSCLGPQHSHRWTWRHWIIRELLASAQPATRIRAHFRLDVWCKAV